MSSYAQNLSQFKTIYNRIDEINRCVGVNNLEMILPILDKQSKIKNYKLRVKNYEDYKKLIDRWPQDSFKTGVIAKSKPIEFEILKHGVKKNRKINHHSSIVKELSNRYGIYNIRRLFRHDKTPCNKLIAKCNEIFDFIRVLKYGVVVNKYKYQVLPNIRKYKVCNSCGSLSHQDKDCTAQQRCLKCGEHEHKIKHCQSKTSTCVNCSGQHFCFSIKRVKYTQKLNQINRFVLKILSGENLIENERDMVGFVATKDSNEQNVFTSKHQVLQNDIENIINNHLNSFNSRSTELENSTSLQNQNLSEIK
ncbi:unnamed protein product [Brachionus calyciflorus]|uniref:CCHC-type domain-containing protein n=1 Tax=Brachionus calyciflorus TaxID=104777 RepID=A0A814MJF8_9BILA|nr:unnamed protein product [Brachionus calyciflorus]